LTVRAATGSEFSQYVISHGLGTARIADDASGFQPDYCVLELQRPIPARDLQQQALALLRTYHELDGGRSLSIHYRDPATGRDVTEADAFFDEPTGTVKLTLNEGNTKRTAVVHVNWSSDATDGN
jgi:hypothetical protein